MPGEQLPSVALECEVEDADRMARRLRTGSPAVFPRIRDDAVLVDLRSVRPEQDALLTAAIRSAST